jgi:IS5 family transposase
MKKEQAIGFADLAVERRKIKHQFFTEINTLIDWRPITTLINRYYTKGSNAVGNPAYPGLLLFKMSLLQTWYNLSDYEVEEQVNDRISFSRFVGLSIDAKAPDHSVLSRFRSIMTQQKAYDKLLKALNKQLEKQQILIRSGQAMIDASVTQSPRLPKGKPEYEIVEDRAEEPITESEPTKEQEPAVRLVKKIQPGVDTQARWLRKGKKLHYGYKKHVVTDREGLVLGVHTTAANVQEIANLEEVLACCDLPQRTALYGDKGYQSQNNKDILSSKKLKSRLMYKAKKKQSLSNRELNFNKAVSKLRYKIERTFGGMKRWFGGGVCRYVGLAKTHTQHLLEAIAYNLYRSPGIIVSNALAMS